MINNKSSEEEIMREREQYRDQVRKVCRFAPVGFVSSVIPIIMSATSDAIPGTISAAIDSIAMISGIAGLGATTCFYAALKLRLKIMASEDADRDN